MIKYRFKVKYKLTHGNKTYIARAVVFAYHSDEIEAYLFNYEERKRGEWFELEVLEVKIEKDPVETLMNFFGMKK
jgi:hypothetical protein